MDNSFEKQIRNKVGQAEVRPSEDLFDAILEKRAARSKTYLGVGYKKLLMLTTFVAVITAGVFYYFLNEEGVTVEHHSTAKLEQSDVPVTDGTSGSNMQSGNSNVSNEASAPEVTKDKSMDKTQAKQKSNGSASSSGLSKSDRSNKNTSAQGNKGLKKIKEGFNGKPAWANADPAAYFNVDAVNRPVIDYEKHQGNSHLFVYESVSQDQLENEVLRYTNASRMSKLQYPFAFEEMNPVATTKTQYNTNPNRSKPLFVDLLFAQVYSTAKTGDAAANELKNGTMNQQFGVRVSAPVKGRLSVFAGLGYMNQILHYRGNMSYNEAYTTINTKVSFINDPIRGVIRVETKDTVRGVAAKARSVDMKNNYSLFRVPLGVGYNFGLGKFDFTVYGSADINVLTSASANTRITEASPVMNHNNNKSLHLGAGLSFMSAYRISPRFRLIAEPGMFYMNLNSRRTGNFASEKIYNFTGTIGLRYSLF